MNFQSQAKFSPGLLLLMAFSAWIVSQSLAIEIARMLLSILGEDPADVRTVLSNGTKNENIIRYVYNLILPVNQLVTFGLLGCLFAYLNGYSLKQYVKLDSKTTIYLFIIPIATVALIPLLQYFIWDSQSFHLPESYKALENQLKQIEMQSKETQGIIVNQSIWISLLILAVFPAVCEELFFRFFLLNNLRQLMSNTLAIVLNGFIFSFIHFQIYGFFARWILGCFFAWSTIRSGSILPAIAAHFTNNALMVVLAVLAANNQIDKSLAEDNYQFSIWITCISLAAFASIIYYIEKQSFNHGQKLAE